MTQLTKLYILIFLSFGILSCSGLSPYKVPILQGNIIEDKDVEQLSKGLTKDQVQYLLGTPLLNSPLHPNRWDYVYSVKIGDQLLGEKKLSLLFDNDQRLTSWSLQESTPNKN
tara:strand:- start:1516 stop:1854 length:339 start_codon:yes stop_codon:yes gene_type:complete